MIQVLFLIFSFSVFGSTHQRHREVIYVNYDPHSASAVRENCDYIRSSGGFEFYRDRWNAVVYRLKVGQTDSNVVYFAPNESNDAERARKEELLAVEVKQRPPELRQPSLNFKKVFVESVTERRTLAKKQKICIALDLSGSMNDDYEELVNEIAKIKRASRKNFPGGTDLALLSFGQEDKIVETQYLSANWDDIFQFLNELGVRSKGGEEFVFDAAYQCLKVHQTEIKKNKNSDSVERKIIVLTDAIGDVNKDTPSISKIMNWADRIQVSVQTIHPEIETKKSNLKDHSVNAAFGLMISAYSEEQWKWIERILVDLYATEFDSVAGDIKKQKLLLLDKIGVLKPIGVFHPAYTLIADRSKEMGWFSHFLTHEELESFFLASTPGFLTPGKFANVLSFRLEVLSLLVSMNPRLSLDEVNYLSESDKKVVDLVSSISKKSEVRLFKKVMAHLKRPRFIDGLVTLEILSYFQKKGLRKLDKFIKKNPDTNLIDLRKKSFESLSQNFKIRVLGTSWCPTCQDFKALNLKEVNYSKNFKIPVEYIDVTGGLPVGIEKKTEFYPEVQLISDDHLIRFQAGIKLKQVNRDFIDMINEYIFEEYEFLK